MSIGKKDLQTIHRAMSVCHDDLSSRLFSQTHIIGNFDRSGDAVYAITSQSPLCECIHLFTYTKSLKTSHKESVSY